MRDEETASAWTHYPRFRVQIPVPLLRGKRWFESSPRVSNSRSFSGRTSPLFRRVGWSHARIYRGAVPPRVSPLLSTFLSVAVFAAYPGRDPWTDAFISDCEI